MSDSVKLIKQLQGDMSVREFAEHVKLGHGTIGDLITGKTRGGRVVIERLVSAFPERRSDILRVFFPENVRNSELMDSFKNKSPEEAS